MGICVYWSCRHVVFVKRCNYLFYLTVADAVDTQGQENKGEKQPAGSPSAAEGGKKVRLNGCRLISRVFSQYY